MARAVRLSNADSPFSRAPNQRLYIFVEQRYPRKAADDRPATLACNAIGYRLGGGIIGSGHALSHLGEKLTHGGLASIVGSATWPP